MRTLGLEPATINVDRNWIIPESTKVGTIVKSVHVQGNSNNNTITYSLESPDDPFNPPVDNPFWIHPHSGYVYLNQSLEGRVSWKKLISRDDFRNIQWT